MRSRLAGFFFASAALGAGSCVSPPLRAADTRPLPAVDLGEARFFARTPGSVAERPLTLVSLAAKVRSSPSTFRTHVTVEMQASEVGQSEAVLRIPVPPGAAVTRAVLWVDERPVEGAFVARQRAGAVYREIVRRKTDPALVTWQGPGWVSVTIFPIEYRSPRRLELEWVEPAATARGQRVYRLPVLGHRGRLIGRPPRISVDGSMTVAPDDGWLHLPGGAPALVAARAPGDPFPSALLRASGAPARPGVLLVAETSAGMGARERWRQHDELESALEALPADARVTLLAADWTSTAFAESASPESARRALALLDARPSAGALDLERALDGAIDRARAQALNGTAPVVVWFGTGRDGFRRDAMTRALARLRSQGIALLVAGEGAPGTPLADVAALSGGGLLESAAALADSLRSARWTSRPATAPAVETIGRWLPLTTVTGEIGWVARLAREAPADTQAAPPQDLGALWARARLDPREPDGAPDPRAQSVLGPLVSILVLENDDAYRRWGLTPPAPLATRASDAEPAIAAHLGSGDPTAGVEVVTGKDAAPNLGSLFGGGTGEAYGIAGILGQGAGSAGLRDGGGAIGGRRAAAPEVIPGTASITGGLDREIVRRVVRRHVNEVRYCYEQALIAHPRLAGRIVVRFTIDAAGVVRSSELAASTMGNARVEGCILAAVRRWPFPTPEAAGPVLVTFPFVFTPAASGPDAAAGAPSDDDRDRWVTTLRLFRRGDLGGVARALERPDLTVPAALGWWVAERARPETSLPVEATLLAAELLRADGSPENGRRVLSERAPTEPDLIASTLAAWGARDEATRVAELAARTVTAVR